MLQKNPLDKFTFRDPASSFPIFKLEGQSSVTRGIIRYFHLISQGAADFLSKNGDILS